MNISEHFTIEELTFSATATRLNIDNTPTAEHIENLTQLAVNILEPLYKLFPQSLRITSCYRSRELNRAIGGAVNSQHCWGQAVDCSCRIISIEEFYQWFKSQKLPVDQVIQEFDRWVHVSYSPKNRRQFLRAIKENGFTKYIPDNT